MTRTFLLLLTTFFILPALQAQDPYQITQSMFLATKKINTLTYEMRKVERVKGEMLSQSSLIKMQRSPYKVYIKQISPEEGVEVLFVENENNNKAVINPNGFPWMNLNLDPDGSLMRKNQHHTIYDSGFDYFIAILEHLYKKYDSEINGMISMEPEAVLNNKSCYVIKFENPHYKLISHQVKQGETLAQISKKYMLGEYMITERNPQISDWSNLSAGSTLSFPNDYSPKMILYIDKSQMLPIGVKVYDQEGLYEHYEFLNVMVNASIDPAEFTTEYEEYGF